MFHAERKIEGHHEFVDEILSKEIFPKCNEDLKLSLFQSQVFIFLVVRCTIIPLKSNCLIL